MSQEWAKELLADVAQDLQVNGTGHWMDGEGETLGTNDALVQKDFQVVLERRLLGLLEAGQRYRDVVDTQDEKSAACDALWDAAKAVASEGKAR